MRVGIVVVAVLFAWQLAGFHVTESRGAITAARAKSITGLTLPPQATNIRAAGYRQWIEYAQYLRFEAPAEVCLNYAATVLPGRAYRAAHDFDLERASHPLRPDAFKDFSWFDLDQARNVMTAGGGPSQPQIWVDLNRGVFYYRKTD